MGGLVLGVNTLYRLFCLFKLFPMVGKGLISLKFSVGRVLPFVTTEGEGAISLVPRRYGEESNA